MITFSSLLLLMLIGVNCKRFTREPKCGDTKHFRFDEELPTFNRELSYCQYYRGETCCNKSHTDKIIKQIYAYHEANVSTECRSIGLNIGCSPCDPRVGTNQIKGICQNYCNYWYDVCGDDFFHYNKGGKLTACSESDVVCSKLSSITNNGTQFCELSGFDVSYISINCYNGIKSKFKRPPNDKQWETPFNKILKAFKSSQLNRNIKELINRYKTLNLWQQMLVIGGFGYTLFAFLKVIINIFLYLIYGKTQNKVSSIPNGIFNGNGKQELNEKELEKIRNKRLQYLAKERMISDQLNMEHQLAKQLGLENELKNHQNDNGQDLMINNNTTNDDDADNEQESDNNDDDDD